MPPPSPFAGALVVQGRGGAGAGGLVAGLRAAGAGEDPLEPPASLGPWPERELRFTRGPLTFGVPVSLVVAVSDAPPLATVPLTPPSHRGLLYHGRAIHPVIDVGVFFGLAPSLVPPEVLLLDAGGAAIGVVADEVLGLDRGRDDDEVLRPPWDTLFGRG